MNKNTITGFINNIVSLRAIYTEVPSFIAQKEEDFDFDSTLLGVNPRDLLMQPGKYTPANDEFTFITFPVGYTPKLIAIIVDQPIGLNMLSISPTLGAAYPIAGLIMEKSLIWRPVQRLDYKPSSISFDSRTAVVGSAVTQGLAINYLALALIDG
jgi:hypothetical protein